MSLGKVPQITYWRERIDVVVRPVTGRGRQRWGVESFGSDRIYVGHAVRNWDVPSNGVFALFTAEEINSYPGWRQTLREKLEARERRLFHEFGRYWRGHLETYFDDELAAEAVEYLLRGAGDPGSGDGLGPQAVR